MWSQEQGDENSDAKRSARPTTARRRPPKVKDGAKEIQSKDVAPTANKKTSGIIVDGAADDVGIFPHLFSPLIECYFCRMKMME